MCTREQVALNVQTALQALGSEPEENAEKSAPLRCLSGAMARDSTARIPRKRTGFGIRQRGGLSSQAWLRMLFVHVWALVGCMGGHWCVVYVTVRQGDLGNLGNYPPRDDKPSSAAAVPGRVCVLLRRQCCACVQIRRCWHR